MAAADQEEDRVLSEADAQQALRTWTARLGAGPGGGLLPVEGSWVLSAPPVAGAVPRVAVLDPAGVLQA